MKTKTKLSPNKYGKVMTYIQIIYQMGYKFFYLKTPDLSKSQCKEREKKKEKRKKESGGPLRKRKK